VRADVPKLARRGPGGRRPAPVLMLFGLDRVTALSGSLLLNLEAPFTVLLAVAFCSVSTSGGTPPWPRCSSSPAPVVLKLESGALGADTAGVLLLAAACLCWALDNNLTQRLTLRDPFAIVRVKTLIAGCTNVTLGLVVVGGACPDVRYLVGAMLLGSVSYGLSVVLDAYALRFIGAAREAAYFATAPFVGALLSVVILGDRVRWGTLLAVLSMLLGVVLLLRERHAHLHTHEPLEHEHLHEHDEHHQHQHAPDDPAGSPHSHRHRHDVLAHDHAHVPEAHHRHRH
jgi:drug/metabolite transporter (DMT)-like permease